MTRRDLLARSTAALGVLCAPAPNCLGSPEADDWRDVFMTIDGEHWHQLGRVQLSGIDREYVERIDNIRQALQEDLRCQYCAIIWDGPPDDITGSASPELYYWPDHLKAKLPFPIATFGRAVNRTKGIHA